MKLKKYLNLTNFLLICFILGSIQINHLASRFNSNLGQDLVPLNLKSPKASSIISITSPAAGSEWRRGNDLTIHWTYDPPDEGESVRIMISSYYGGFTPIVESTPCDGDYIWHIPEDIICDDEYRIMITFVSTGYGNTGGMFTIYDNVLYVQNPHSVSILEKYSYEQIQWVWGGYISNVGIELRQGGSYIDTLTSSTPNDGEWEWFVDPIYADGTYKIRIFDIAEPETYDDSDAFDIITDPTPKTLTVEYPNSATYWKRGTQQSIEWSSTGVIERVKIDLYKNSFWEQSIITETSNNGFYDWVIPSSLDNSFLYQIKISDINTPTFGISEEFEIYYNSLTITDPEATDIWHNGTYQYITWDSTGHISDVKIDLYKASLWELTISASTINDGQFGWNIPSDIDEYSFYRVQISDLTDGSINDMSDYFEIDHVYNPDTITVLLPNSSTHLIIGDTLTITWTTTGSISSLNIALYKDDLWVNDIEIGTSNDGELKWNIPDTLSPSTQYQVKITDSENSGTFKFSNYFEISEPSQTEDDGSSKDDNTSQPNSVPADLNALLLFSIFIIGILVIFVKQRRIN